MFQVSKTKYHDNRYHKLSTVVHHNWKRKKVLDVFNRGRFSYMAHLVSMENFSGQQWLIEKSKMEHCYRLRTTFSEINMWLDVIDGGVFDGLLIIVPEEKYSGRLWEIKETHVEEKSFKVSTFFNGENKFIDLHEDGDFINMPYVVNETRFSGQLWKLENKNQSFLKCL